MICDKCGNDLTQLEEIANTVIADGDFTCNICTQENNFITLLQAIIDVGKGPEFWAKLEQHFKRGKS